MKMPIMENDIEIKTWMGKKFPSLLDWLSNHNPFVVHDRTSKTEPNFFVPTFDKDRMKEFIDYDKPDIFFSSTERSRLVYYMCEQTRYGDDSLDIGIDSLLHKGVFNAQYPIHDGPLNDLSEEPVNDPQRLH